jgi:hypothetical protein
MDRALRPYTQQDSWGEVPQSNQDEKYDTAPVAIQDEQARLQAIQEQIDARERSNTPRWLEIIDDLAQGDRTKWDFFFDLTVTEGLNAYSFRMAKANKLADNLVGPSAEGYQAFMHRAMLEILFTR